MVFKHFKTALKIFQTLALLFVGPAGLLQQKRAVINNHVGNEAVLMPLSQQGIVLGNVHSLSPSVPPFATLPLSDESVLSLRIQF